MHEIDIRALVPAIEILKKVEAEALVLNGDLFGERSKYRAVDYFATVLDITGKSNLETYVLPGSHETVEEFEHVLNIFTKKYGNIINTFGTRKIEKEDHHLVFLQGSDWRAGNAIQNGYSLENQNESGLYQNDNGGLIRIVNMNDLKKIVNKPEKTIVFSHVPRKFDSADKGVDMAEFWEVFTPFKIENRDIEVGTVLPGPAGYRLANIGAPIKLKKENRGNEYLKKIFEELGIRKNITGHFHESCGRANDLKGNFVEEGTFVDELFYNASYMDKLKAGIVTVSDSKIAYENINLREFIG